MCRRRQDVLAQAGSASSTSPDNTGKKDRRESVYRNQQTTHRPIVSWYSIVQTLLFFGEWGCCNPTALRDKNAKCMWGLQMYPGVQDSVGKDIKVIWPKIYYLDILTRDTWRCLVWVRPLAYVSTIYKGNRSVESLTLYLKIDVPPYPYFVISTCKTCCVIEQCSCCLKYTILG